MLNGGLEKWQELGFPTTTEVPKYKVGSHLSQFGHIRTTSCRVTIATARLWPNEPRYTLNDRKH